MKKYKYNFPKNNRAGSVITQLKHCSGELIEIALEVGDFSKPYYSARVIDEVYDAIECLEGILRVAEEHGVSNLEDRTIRRNLYQAHYIKNKNRGDYE